jgi:hypothetical protein
MRSPRPPRWALAAIISASLLTALATAVFADSAPWNSDNAPDPTPSAGQVSPAPTGGPVPSATLRGWSSGASGSGVTDGTFGTWRGSPATITAVWADTDAQTQEEAWAITELSNWAGDVDLAVGGTAVNSDETYEQAAQGAFVKRWTHMAQTVQKYRGSSPGATYLRAWHEFNGDWYHNWQVTPKNVAHYKKAFKLMATTIRENCPSCKIVWSPNNRSSSGSASIDEAYPGNDLVDVVSIDSYNANGNAIVVDNASWNEYALGTHDSEPAGVEKWRQWAESHGKPLGLSEWGLNPADGGGDNPEYIRHMNAWMTEHAAIPGNPNVAGRILYDCYFNVKHESDDGFLIKDGPNPQSASVYRSVRWGNWSDEPVTAPTGDRN